jgi:hypothetical protein
MPHLVYTPQEVIAQHGTGPPLPIDETGWCLLPDGAEVSFHSNRGDGGPVIRSVREGRRYELEGRLRYLRTFLAMLRRTFNSQKEAMLLGVARPFSSQEAALFQSPDLEHLRQLFSDHAAKAREIETELNSLFEVIGERRREQEKACPYRASAPRTARRAASVPGKDCGYRVARRR